MQLSQPGLVGQFWINAKGDRMIRINLPSFNNFLRRTTVEVETERERFRADHDIYAIMTFEDAIRYFVEKRPKTQVAAKGVMMREPSRLGYLVTLAFLDEKGNVIGGRSEDSFHGQRYFVKQFDRELEERFGNKDVILFE